MKMIKVFEKPKLGKAIKHVSHWFLDRGLSGLRETDTEGFGLETRLDMLTSVLELLCHLNVLDSVGEELLCQGRELLFRIFFAVGALKG